MEALLRLKEVQDQTSRDAYLDKQRQVTALEQEIGALRARKDAIVNRSGGHALHERLLLDALIKRMVERTRVLDALRRESEALLDSYRQTANSKKAVSALQARRSSEQAQLDVRRDEEVASDLAASRGSKRRLGPEVDDEDNGAREE